MQNVAQKIPNLNLIKLFDEFLYQLLNITRKQQSVYVFYHKIVPNFIQYSYIPGLGPGPGPRGVKLMDPSESATKFPDLTSPTPAAPK